eukprot:4086055-Prorocentrum_lima.AAC.1
MTSSLVGSEMCIRDRLFIMGTSLAITANLASKVAARNQELLKVHYKKSVSYTHLTLPTICSV